MKLRPLVSVALLFGGAYLWHHRNDRVQAYRTSGTVTLRPGVRYAYQLLWPLSGSGLERDLSASTAMSQAVVELMKQNTMPQMQETADGMVIRFQATPAVPTTLVLGSKIVGDAFLQRISRLDGKEWDAP